MEQPRVGVLISNRVYRKMWNGEKDRERLDFYVEAAARSGVQLCFMRLADISLDRLEATACLPGPQGYERKRIPLPFVIHNRTLYFKQASKLKLNKLSELCVVFNGGNRYGKVYIHDLLMENDALRPHLPGTKRATRATLRQWMKHYDEIILKPDSSSIGKGIYKLKKSGSAWLFQPASAGNGRARRRIRFRKKLPPSLLKLIRSRPYVVQQCLPLAHYDDKPFDIRVSVQKDETGEWQVTGMAVKVAAKGKFVTNVAQGGAVYQLEHVLQALPHLNTNQVEQDLQAFSLSVAEQLDKHLPNLADIGLDVGITSQGFPVFIECNNRDLRYSFDKAGLPDAWRSTYANPIGYAVYLIQQAARKYVQRPG
ncbi:YheC/YheD family protein [Xylanibacillus composti]|uniref:YheC/YheD family protein n=1 Tax=Xylanibacillus composti TaxID=1572762 RepID=A0A8J4M152_9BACL|nr:YheC/YheD family protein [Xylanibacillus composti]MDT9723459.1 YheC/YheD family protein [Xylanibacillus composti]GIQ68505.1 hypothetical protein XYCOK13_13290 [Xylanibacillus composti]